MKIGVETKVGDFKRLSQIVSSFVGVFQILVTP